VIDSPAVADGALEAHRMTIVELRAGLDDDVNAAFGEFVDTGVAVLDAVIGFVQEPAPSWHSVGTCRPLGWAWRC
jgi:hypothetical protein